MTPRTKRWVVSAGAVVLAAIAILVPFVANSSQQFLLETIAVQALFATSVALLWGTGNIPSFGQAMFFGIGSFVTAELVTRMPHLPMAVDILLSIAAAGVAGVIVGYISLRVRGIAFSMVTLAIAQAVYLVAFTTNLVGGENGIAGVFVNISSDALWYITIGCVVLGIGAYYLISRSPFAQALRAIKNDPKRMSCLGIRVRQYELAAFVLAALGAGFAGALFAFVDGVVTSDTLYWTQSGMPVIMLIVGGIGSFWGPVVGSVVIELFTQYLQQMTNVSILFIGLILVAVLLWLPKGILGIRLPRRKEGRA